MPENVAGDEPACEARKPVPETHIPVPDDVLSRCREEAEEEYLLSLWADAKKSGFIMWGKLKYIRVVLCVVVAASVAGSACAPKRPPARAEGLIDGEKHNPYYLFIRSDLLSMEGSTDQSTDELKELIEAQPQAAFPWLLMAQNYSNERKFDPAVEAAQRAVSIDPQFYEAQFFLAKLYIAQKKHDEAIAALEKITAQHTKYEEPYLLLAREYVVQEKLPKAIATLKRLIAVDPDSVRAYYYLGGIYAMKKRPHVAIAVYRKGLVVEPGNVAILTSMGQLYLEREQYANALAVFKRIGEIDPADYAVQLRIALIYYQLKRYNDAVGTFQRILDANPEADKIRYYLGMLYENIERYDAALVEFEAVPPYSTYYVEARLRSAAIYRQQGKNADAIRVLREGVDVRKKELILYKYFAALLEEDRDYRGAIEMMQRASKMAPDEVNFHFLLGILYEKVMERDKAIAEMKKVLEVEPDNASALNYVGYTYADRGEKLVEAEAMVGKALALKPTSGYIMDSYGWVLFKTGDVERARVFIQKAYGQLPNEPTIIYHLGRVVEAQGNSMRALELYQQALAQAVAREERDEEEIEIIQKSIDKLTGEQS